MAGYVSKITGDSDLLAYWRLTESAGATSVADSGPSGYTGTPSNVTFGASAILGGSQGAGSATFNGTSSTVAGHSSTASGALDFDYTDPFTVEFVIRPNVTRSGGTTNHPVVSKYAANDTTTGWEIWIVWNGSATRILVRTRVNSSNQYVWTTTLTDLLNATNYHVVVTYNPANAASSKAGIYVNGAGETQSITGSGPNASIKNSNPIVLGSRNGGQLFGKFDLEEVSIYDRVFTAAEIAERAVRAHDLSGWSQPVKLILDTDSYTDSDDAGALATALNLATRGEADVLSANCNTGFVDVPYAVSAILDHYGYSSVPIAQTASGELTSGTGAWANYVEANYPYSLSSPANSLNTYRQTLHDAADGTVTVCSLGYLWDVKALLQSSADGIDSRNGVDLVTAKVARLVVMGGDYLGNPATGNENNFNRNATAKSAANYVCANWPTAVPIYFVGYSVGLTVLTGSQLDGQEDDNPVAGAYFSDLGSPIPDHESWDATAALFAVRGQSHSGTPLFALVRGTNSVNSSTGVNTFTKSTTGPHYYVLKAMSDADMATLLEELYQSPIEGQAAVTLGGLQTALAGTVAVQGSASPTLSALSLSSAGEVQGQSAALDVTLATVAISAAGTVQNPPSGALSATLASVTLAGVMTAEHLAALDRTLGTLTLSAAGTLNNPVGEADVTLAALTTTSATGGVLVQGTSSVTLAALTVAEGVGSVVLAGAASMTLSALRLFGRGLSGATSSPRPPTAATDAVSFRFALDADAVSFRHTLDADVVDFGEED